MNANASLKILAIVLVVAAVIAVISLKNRSEPLQTEVTVEPAGQVAMVAESGEQTEPAAAPDPSAAAAAVADPLPKLVDLGATTCIPCKRMAPILDQLAEDFAGQMEVVFIDVRKDRAAGVPYKIRVIPTQIFYDAEGNELFRHEGFFSREDILAKWAEFGFEFSSETDSAEGA